MALEWLKTILGDSYTDDIETKVSAQIGKDFVSRTDFNTLNGEKKTLTGQITERDKQLTDLKAGAGNSEELKKQIDTLQEANKTAASKYDADIKQIKLDAKLDAKLSGAHAVNTKAVKSLLDLSKVSLDGDNLVGVDDQIAALQKSETWAFHAPENTDPAPGSTGMEHGGATGNALSGVEQAFYAHNPGLAPKK